ncbi:MAG TPA: polyprenyl synthetase family protein [Pseudomonas xinjiangensis]|uniref:Polyprenyl synthetase family protein n=2 Tax=root TaxID=1 RepID=A0A7V1BPD2_9GAMM|nr:polyprenyl synthetase family protein [Halopseudomonas xinjiangensis]HEC47307.1 polyprenyl synthetase family protein [Halopseudomonas xinjiangensis]
MDQVSAAYDDAGLYGLAAVRAEIDRRLAEVLPPDSQGKNRIGDAMREGTLAAGKRVRPTLLILAARGLGCESPALIDLGCAVEMIHAGSLIVDDMPCMDNANVRRGQPTIHRRFGEDVAVLTAVALLTKAFSLVSSLAEVPPDLRAQLVSKLADAVGMQGLVKGQYEDLHDGAHPRSAEEIAATNELKTGVLFGATLHMAALIAEATEAQRELLEGFAFELGHAFQLLDDLMDGTQLQDKDCGKDEGKSTLVALLGPDAVKKQLATHLEKADLYLAELYGPEQLISRFMHRLFDDALKRR